MFGRGMNMQARVVKKNGKILILCNDGTISISSYSSLRAFLSSFTNCSAFTGNDGKWTDESLDMGEYPGETSAYVTDQGALVVLDPNLLSNLLSDDSILSDYLTIDEYAKKYDRSASIIKAYIQDNRIPGVVRFGRQVAIPKDAPYPVEVQRRKPTSGQRSTD
jgi:hypothetical protein